MAVLEKIRKRSVLLFIIIVGALLAFILGDFLNSGRSLFGPGDTLAQVDNAKVKQMDFNKQSDQLENYVKQAKAYGQDIPAEMADPGYRYQQALDAALYERLMAIECERLGIEVSDEFISKIVANPTSSGFVWQTLMGQLGGNAQETMATLQQAGIVDPVTYLDAIKNPARYRMNPQDVEGLSQAWKAMENALAQQVQFNLYNQMLDAMMQPNKADAKAYFDNKNTLAAVQVASVPLSSVNDAEITIGVEDFEPRYNMTKDGFRILDENREVAFIIVPILPSEKDFEKANTEAKALVADLQTMELAEALGEHRGFSHKSMKVAEEDMNRDVQFAALRMDSAGIHAGMVRELFAPRNSKAVAKVNGISSGIDKVSYTFFPVESVEQADSLFADKNVAAVDSVITAMTGGQLVNMSTSLINPDQANYAGYFASMPAMVNALTTAPLNEYYFVNDTTGSNNLTGVLVVKERGEQVPVYDISVMTYEVYPSEETRRDLTQQLHNYVANNPTAGQFVNDTTGTYNVMYSMISPNSYTLASSQLTPDTRPVVKWAMDAKKGAVSPVYSRQRTVYGRNGQPDETNDYLIAVAVVDVYDDYVPYTSHIVQEGLRAQVTADKKAQILKEKYSGKGKNIAEYASAMGVSPQNMNVAFGAGTIGGEAQGVVAAAKKGDVVGPLQGNNAVYVFQVDEITAPEFDAADLKARLDEVSRGFRTPQAGLEMLIGNRKVKNNTLHFTMTPDAE